RRSMRTLTPTLGVVAALVGCGGAHAQGGAHARLAASASASGAASGTGSAALPAPGAARSPPPCPRPTNLVTPPVLRWPAPDRAALDVLSQRGLVLAAYESCRIELLPQCHASAGYGYFAVTRKRQVEEIANDFDLYSKLPSGAARLQATLHQYGSLRVT